MCRGFQLNDRLTLNIKSFYIHFSSISTSATTTRSEKLLPDSLTLHLLPRTNRDPLDINGSSTRLGPPAFLTLYRVLSADSVTLGAMYGSRDPVKAAEGVRFEVYYDGGKILKGAIRRYEGQNWKLDCKRDGEDFAKDADMEVAVEVDGHVALLSNKVDMRRSRRKWNRNLPGLEEIPEEGELESDGCCYCDCECGEGTGLAMDDGDCEMDLELESVRWAVDAAILVVSLGVGYLVSKASCKKLTRPWR